MEIRLANNEDAASDSIENNRHEMVFVATIDGVAARSNLQKEGEN